MILYGMSDPIAALEVLAPRLTQIHLKDAVSAQVPGTWGTEVRLGEGEVNWDAFFRVYDEKELDCDLLIERETGSDRVRDIRLARERVERWIGS